MNVPIQKAEPGEGALAPPRRVLIVDDDSDFGESLAELLALDGYRIEFASDAKSATTLAGTFEPEVALVDVRLGRESGIDLIDALSEACPGLDCILMSAYADLESAIKAVRHNAYDYLRKPIEDHDLLAALERCFEKRLLAREKLDLERRAAAALHASEVKFRKLTEGSIEGIVIHREFRALFVNQAYAEIFGYGSPDEILAMDDILPMFAPHERERAQRYRVQRLAGENVPDQYEFEGVRNDGAPIWLENRVRVVDWEGAPATQAIVVDITERKQAEDALKESESRLANAQRIAHIGNWDWEIVAGDLYWSDEIYRIFGLEPQEFGATYEAFLATVHPDDRTMVEEAVNAALDEHVPYSIDHRIVLPSGDVRLVHEQGEVERNEDGEPVAMRGTVQDITERRWAEDALGASVQRFKDFAGSASDFFWEMDAELRFSYFSERFTQVTGVEPEALIGKTRQDAPIPDVDPEAWEKQLADLAAHRPFRGFVHPRTRPNGEVVHVSINGTPCFDEDGNFQGYRGTGSDITERIQAEEALRESEARTRGILENVADGVITMTEDSRIETFNTAAEKLFGYAAREVIGRPVTKLMTSGDRRLHSSYVRGYLRAGHSKILGVGPRRLVARRKDGSTFPISLAVGEVHAGDRRLFIGSIRDITERQRAEEALRWSEASLAEAQRMAHLGSWERDIETGRATWSDELYRIFGYKRGAVEPSLDRVAAVVHPAERDAFVEESQRALAEDLDGYEHEYRIVRRDGSERFIHSQAETVRDETGKPVKFIGTVHDITDRKRAELELEAQSVVLQVILDTMDQGISVADADLNIIACNAKFLELLEFPPEMGAVRPFDDYIRYNAERGEYGPGNVEEQVKERVQLAKQFKPHRFERVRPDGTAIEIRGNPSASGGTAPESAQPRRRPADGESRQLGNGPPDGQGNLVGPAVPHFRLPARRGGTKPRSGDCNRPSSRPGRLHQEHRARPRGGPRQL
jgi:PAS domain S-box-containing protein